MFTCCFVLVVFAELLLLPEELHEADPPGVPSPELPGGSGLPQ